MNRENRFDIIIAGAGAAGLTLLWYILNSPVLQKREILLLDKSFEPKNDKTWCFWDSNDLPLNEFIYHSWNELEVGALGSSFNEELITYRYDCIRNGDYSMAILDTAENFENITFIEASIQNFSSDEKIAVVETDKGKFTASHVFQSVLKPPDFETSTVDNSLLQHFVGWEIETDSSLFNPDKAVLMDFNVPQLNGVTFMYILPFSENRALIEHTLFSDTLLEQDVYEGEIRNYLSEHYDLGSARYRILRKEKGAIPMEDRKYSTWYCENVMNIGTMGGLTKPTTGYTFTRIHKKSIEIVSALERDEKIPEDAVSSYRFRVYDMMLLYLLSSDQHTSVRIFHDLFKKNSFDMILRFLEEKTTLSNEISIFSTLPYLPFFKSIYKMKHRIFTGR